MEKVSKKIFKNPNRYFKVLLNGFQKKIPQQRFLSYKSIKTNNTVLTPIQSTTRLQKRNMGMSEIWNSRNSQEFIDSVKTSLSILSLRGSWNYSEAWMLNENESSLKRFDTW